MRAPAVYPTRDQGRFRQRETDRFRVLRGLSPVPTILLRRQVPHTIAPIRSVAREATQCTRAHVPARECVKRIARAFPRASGPRRPTTSSREVAAATRERENI